MLPKLSKMMSLFQRMAEHQKDKFYFGGQLENYYYFFDVLRVPPEKGIIYESFEPKNIYIKYSEDIKSFEVPPNDKYAIKLKQKL